MVRSFSRQLGREPDLKHQTLAAQVLLSAVLIDALHPAF
jgi:hypothetical protein